MQQIDENGFQGYQIRRLKKFERTYELLIKSHYRRDKKSRGEFENLINSFIEELENSECPEELGEKEPFPNKTAQDDLDLRKKRWKKLPGLQGAARYGRLIFVVNKNLKIVYLVWIYTHAEYQEPKSRPPDKELMQELLNINNLKEESLD